MGWLKAIADRRKTGTGAQEKAAVDWDAFVEQSLAETTRKQAEKTAQHVASKPMSASEQPRLGLVPLVGIVGVSAAVLILAVVGLGHVLSPETAIRFRANESATSTLVSPSSRAQRPERREPIVRLPEPTSNRDPSKSPGPGYVWVRGSTDKNGVQRDGHWRSKPK